MLLVSLCMDCQAQEADVQLYQLKVRYAKSIGLDTLPQIVNQVQLYKRSLLLGTLVDAYKPDASMVQSWPDQVVVKQVFKKTPQNISSARLSQLQQQMDSIYRLLQQGASFDEMMLTYSDQKEAFHIQKLQMPEEFEERAFRMCAGEVSAPFTSPLGIHIIQVVSHMQGSSFALGQEQIIRQMLPLLSETLKKELAYQENEENCKDLLRRGQSDRVLFTIAGKEYTGTDFARFLAANDGSLSSAFSQFITKSLLDVKLQGMQQDEAAFASKQEAFLNDLLVTEATLLEVVRPSEDELALKTYFDTHQDDFRWPQERYKGILIQAKTKKMAKRAAKLVKKEPYEALESLLAQRFTGEGTLRIQKGVFAQGDNPYVDQLVFKGAKAIPAPDYPYAAVQGKKIKGPETYDAVPHDTLVLAFQSFLENQWQKRLKSMK